MESMSVLMMLLCLSLYSCLFVYLRVFVYSCIRVFVYSCIRVFVYLRTNESAMMTKSSAYMRNTSYSKF